MLSDLNRRYRPALMSFFLRRVRNHADAEDLTQEVFAKLASSSTDVEKPDSYIFQIAANLLKDRGRREKVRALYRAQAPDPDEGVETIDPERLAIGRDVARQTAIALHEMHERTRAILILFRLENMKQREIADMFGISVSAVEKHIVKGTALLASRIGKPS